MRTIKISDLKLLKVSEVKEMMPLRVTADGSVLGIFQEEGQVKEEVVEKTKTPILTQCPNCKMKYNVIEPDDLPSFFSIQHP